MSKRQNFLGQDSIEIILSVTFFCYHEIGHFINSYVKNLLWWSVCNWTGRIAYDYKDVSYVANTRVMGRKKN